MPTPKSRTGGSIDSRTWYTGTVSTLTSGTAPAVGTDLLVSEGETYLLRLVATDLHGNTGTNVNLLRFGVPYDDGNVLMEYNANWASTANASYFGGGYHTPPRRREPR
jgi:hypothetical protein